MKTVTVAIRRAWTAIDLTGDTFRRAPHGPFQSFRVRTFLDTNVTCELDPFFPLKKISADGPHRTTVALILTVHPMYDPSYSIALQTPKISFITRKKKRHRWSCKTYIPVANIRGPFSRNSPGTCGHENESTQEAQYGPHHLQPRLMDHGLCI